MKYIIELEKLEGTDLYKAKGANTLVFDNNGIKNILTKYHEPIEHDSCEGCKHEGNAETDEPCRYCKWNFTDKYVCKPKKTVKRWETYNGDFSKAVKDFRETDCIYGQPCEQCRFTEKADDISQCIGLWLMEDIEVEE